MRLRLLLFAFLSVFLFNYTQGQCLEITSIFVNACGNPEGENEMFTFQVGTSALPVNDISVDWPSNSFLGWCQNAGTATSTATLNSSITNGCGYLLEPVGGMLPANANVIVITSTNFNTTFNSFSNLSDTMYILYQCDGNTGGHFSNSPTTSVTWPLGTRDLIVNVTGTCTQTEIATYDNTIANLDGETALFDAAGNLSYTNNGCNAPVISISVNWAFTDEICNDYGVIDLSTLLSGNATPGGTWSGPRVTGTNYDPTGYIGLDSATYSIAGSTSCSANIDSTIVFNVIQPMTGTANLASCDSVFYNGTWYNSSTTFSDTIFGSGYACDSVTNFTVTISGAITDSSYVAACDSVQFDGNTYFTDIILRDTVFAGAGPSVIDTILQTGFEDSEGWVDQSSGNWTQVDANGTWTANDMYANQFNPNNGIRNVGLNDVGDYLEFPPVDNPQTLYYYNRLSGAATGTNELTIEYFDGTNWIAITSDICTSQVYELVTIDLSTISGLSNVAIRIYRSADQRSAYIDDIVIVGSTTGGGTACDSISITNIDILDPVTTQNPANPIVICDSNDSTQLADGTFVSAAGTYPIVFTGGSSSGCDSTFITVVQTQTCNFTCSFDTVLYDSFEYDSVIPGIVPSKVIHTIPRGTTSPFIGKSRTGTRYAYFNFQGTPGAVAYSREIEICPGTDFRYSFWCRQFDNNAGSNITINIYDGNSNAAPLLNTFNLINNGTAYNQITSAVMTGTTGSFFFELIDNLGGPIVGNDFILEDFIVEACLVDTLMVPSQNFCLNNSAVDLYTYVSSNTSTNGTWNGPSALTNGHLGTFDPASNTFGTYYYSTPGPSNCVDTTISITLSSITALEDTLTFTACDSILNNGTWYFTNTTLRDTLIGGTVNGCDSIYQTNLIVNSSITMNNPGNPFIICADNDSVLLPGGAYAYTSGNYSFTYPGGSANGCDSIILTEVLTEICDCNINLGPDTAFCQGGSLFLDAGAGFDSYTWQDNSTNQTFTANTSGTYHCTVTYLDSSNNLVSNGDFEQGNTGFTTDYGAGVGGAFGLLTNPGTYAINTSPSNVHNNFFSCSDHSGSGNMMIVNGSNIANTNVWCQNITVVPNTDYLFSAWATSLENTNISNVSTLHFLIDGVQFGPNFSPTLTACDWQQFSTSWNSGANTTIQICIESDVISGNNDYAIDDIFFTPYCIATDSVSLTVNPTPSPDLGPDVAICAGTDTLLDATTANASYLWQDGTTTTPTFTASNTGLYFVDVTVNGCTGRDSLNLISNPVFNITDNILICEGDSAFVGGAWQTQTGMYADTFVSVGGCDSIFTTTLDVIVLETITEIVTVCENELPVLINGNLESTAGMYTDTIVSSLGCDSVISNIELVVNPMPLVTLGMDTTIDQGNVFFISVLNADANDTYTWTNSLGETFTGSSIQANASNTATYVLNSTNEFNCTEFDSILIVVNPLEQTLLQIPSAFSPNGDGVNEVFRIANFEDFDSYILRIYNRWGELIFDNEGYNVSWNGSYKEVMQNVDTYVFYIEATPSNGGTTLNKTGNVTLIR